MFDHCGSVLAQLICQRLFSNLLTPFYRSHFIPKAIRVGVFDRWRFSSLTTVWIYFNGVDTSILKGDLCCFSTLFSSEYDCTAKLCQSKRSWLKLTFMRSLLGMFTTALVTKQRH